MIKNEVIVTRKDIISLGYCAKGSRQLFKRYGWSWNDFLDHGISSSICESTGDAMVLKAVEHARRRVNGEQ